MAAPMETCKSSSMTVTVVDTGEHLFKVLGHSLLTGSYIYLTSETFRVGGHDWAIIYYPNGDSSIVDDQFSSVFLQLVSTFESEVTASFSFCLQDPASPATGEKNKKSYTTTFLPNDTDWGASMFMSKDDLAASGCLIDDCLAIKCTVQISKLIEDTHEVGDHKSSIIVPPSDLSSDLRNLMQSGHKADLIGKIGKLRFGVHTCLLAARSPALLAKLRGSMDQESKESSISVEDMNAKLFTVLTYYLYTDCLPGFMEENTEEATSMAQDLLVQANVYGIQRLKLMCERRLSQSLSVNTVSSTLDFAVENDCKQLKDCCLKYMTADFERLTTIKGTKGFEHLRKTRPPIVCDILSKVIDRLHPQDVITFPP